jgi:predicted dehydrogenase
MQRRTFLLSTALGASQIAGANERIRGAIIGSGGRGRFLTDNFKELGVDMAAVCDVYEPNLEKGLKAASSGAKGYDNYKRVLEDPSIQVAVIATPDHWHAQMVIGAVEAGKDVYVEKPMVHRIEDGFRVIDAVRRTRRVVQVGMQRRSFDLFQEGKKLMDRAGEVRLVNSWWLNNQTSLAHRNLGGKLDWNQWLGPAPKRDLDPMRFFNWYYFWDYSGGLMVGQAAHIIDLIHWFMNSTYPQAVTCAGGRVNLAGAEVPETTSMAIEYPEDYLAVFTLGYKAMHYASTNDQMNQFHGAKARLDMGRESYALYPQTDEVEMKPAIEMRRPGSFDTATRAHIRNFLECVRSRQDPNATVETGQQTAVVLSMAIDALRQGRRLKWNADKRKVEV